MVLIRMDMNLGSAAANQMIKYICKTAMRSQIEMHTIHVQLKEANTEMFFEVSLSYSDIFSTKTNDYLAILISDMKRYFPFHIFFELELGSDKKSPLPYAVTRYHVMARYEWDIKSFNVKSAKKNYNIIVPV